MQTNPESRLQQFREINVGVACGKKKCMALSSCMTLPVGSSLGGMNSCTHGTARGSLGTRPRHTAHLHQQVNWQSELQKWSFIWLPKKNDTVIMLHAQMPVQLHLRSFKCHRQIQTHLTRTLTSQIYLSSPKSNKSSGVEERDNLSILTLLSALSPYWTPQSLHKVGTSPMSH